MAKPPPSIAVTSTLAMVRAAAAQGSDTGAVLRELKIDAAVLEDPDARLPGPTVLAVWNALRAATGDPTLQLVAPAALPFGAYRIIDYRVTLARADGGPVPPVYVDYVFAALITRIRMRIRPGLAVAGVELRQPE